MGSGFCIRISAMCNFISVGYWKFSLFAGQGWYCHLIALRTLASTTGGPVPAIFQDPAYTKISHRTLLTAGVWPAAGHREAANPPPSPSGISVTYKVMEDEVEWTSISHPNSPSLSDFQASVYEVFDEIQEVLSNRSWLYVKPNEQCRARLLS